MDQPRRGRVVRGALHTGILLSGGRQFAARSFHSVPDLRSLLLPASLHRKSCAPTQIVGARRIDHDGNPDASVLSDLDGIWRLHTAVRISSLGTDNSVGHRIQARTSATVDCYPEGMGRGRVAQCLGAALM